MAVVIDDGGGGLVTLDVPVEIGGVAAVVAPLTLPIEPGDVDDTTTGVPAVDAAAALGPFVDTGVDVVELAAIAAYRIGGRAGFDPAVPGAPEVGRPAFSA